MVCYWILTSGLLREMLRADSFNRFGYGFAYSTPNIEPLPRISDIY